MLNRAKDYYKNDTERLREQATNKYRNLSEEDKEKKREYGKNRYRNMSEEKKQKLKEYQKQRYEEAKESRNHKQNNVFTIESIYLYKLTEIKAYQCIVNTLLGFYLCQFV